MDSDNKQPKKPNFIIIYILCFLIAVIFEFYWITVHSYDYFMLIGIGVIILIFGYLTLDSFFEAKREAEQRRLEQNEVIIKASKAIYLTMKRMALDETSSFRTLTGDNRQKDISSLVRDLAEANERLSREVEQAMSVRSYVQDNENILHNVQEVMQNLQADSSTGTTDATDIADFQPESTDTADVPAENPDVADIPAESTDVADIPAESTDVADVPAENPDVADTPVVFSDNFDTPEVIQNTSDTSDTLEDTQDIADIPEVIPEITPDNTDVPEDIQDTPGSPDIPDTTDVPQDIQDTPENADLPEVIPEITPDNTDVPQDIQDTPDSPDIPDTTDVPEDIQDAPDIPDNADLAEDDNKQLTADEIAALFANL